MQFSFLEGALKSVCMKCNEVYPGLYGCWSPTYFDDFFFWLTVSPATADIIGTILIRLSHSWWVLWCLIGRYQFVIRPDMFLNILPVCHKTFASSLPLYKIFLSPSLLNNKNIFIISFHVCNKNISIAIF